MMWTWADERFRLLCTWEAVMGEAKTIEERQVAALEQLVKEVAALHAEVGALKSTIQGLRNKLGGDAAFPAQ